MKKITDALARTVTEPGFYWADDTLYLCVKKSGWRSWIQRVVIDGRRHDIGLGPYPIVSLSKARQKAFENRVAIYEGRNPLLEKRRSTIPVFKTATDNTHKALAPTFKSKLHTKNWMQVLEKHALPKLGNIPVDRITQQDVLNVLEPIWHARPDTARRVRQRIRAILKHCQAHGYIAENVAGDAIDGALPAMPKVKENFRALDYRETPGAIKAIETKVTATSPRLCLQFLILTATRSNEARQATWCEIDSEAATWNIPGDRMKNGKVHRVPLSATALKVLVQAGELRNDSDLIFPSATDPQRPMTSATLIKHLRKIGLAEKTTVHGFRTSFRTWASECTDIPREVCEMALAHTVGNSVEQAYSRSDLLKKRVSLMRLWDGFLSGE